MIVPKSAKQTMLIIPNTALDRMIDAALVNEDKRGNIVRLLGLSKKEADRFHKMSPKWSFFLAKMNEEAIEWKVQQIFDLENPSSPRVWGKKAVGRIHNFLKENPSEFKNIKNLAYIDTEKFMTTHFLSKRIDKKEIILKLDDGFFWHESPEKGVCPDWIGKMMQHCGVDNEGYLITLFDKNYEPHVTLTWKKEDNRITQIRGKQNDYPVEKYWPHIGEFIKQLRVYPGTGISNAKLNQYMRDVVFEVPGMADGSVANCGADEGWRVRRKCEWRRWHDQKLHREDGPAIEYPNGEQENQYYLDGIWVSAAIHHHRHGSLKESLLTEDKRGNIVRLLGYSKEEADEFHNVNPKWSFSLAKWYKEYAGEESIERARELSSSAERIYIALSGEGSGFNNYDKIIKFLKDKPSEFGNIKNLSFVEASAYTAQKRKSDLINKKDIVLQLKDGFFWHKSPEKGTCPSWIKDLMQHCGVDERGYLITLFDKDYNPHITLTWNKEENRITQIRGKQNDYPIEKYWWTIAEFIKQLKVYPGTGISNAKLNKYMRDAVDDVTASIPHRIEGHTPRVEWRRWSDNELHREDGPAYISDRGQKEWFIGGIHHRTDGPATEWASGEKSWYLNGVVMSEDEWKERVKTLQEDIGVTWYKKVYAADTKNKKELIGQKNGSQNQKHVDQGKSYSEDPPPRPKVTDLSAPPAIAEEIIEEISQPAQLLNTNLLKKLDIGDKVVAVFEDGLTAYGMEVLKPKVTYEFIKKTTNGFSVSPPIRGRSAVSLENFAKIEKNIDQTKVQFEIHKKEGGTAAVPQQKDEKPLSNKKQQQFGKKVVDKYLPNAPEDFESMLLTTLLGSESVNTGSEVIEWFKSLLSLIFGMNSKGMGYEEMGNQLFHTKRKALDLSKGGSAVIFGDSQVGGGIGRAFKEKLKEKGYDVCSDCKMHVNGSSIRYWAKNLNLKYLLEEKQPSLVVISLGGNGGSSGAKSLVDKIKQLSPKSRIIWSGVPPAVKATRSGRQKPKKMAQFRQQTNIKLQQALGDIYIDPSDYMPDYRSSPDGIHVPYKDAKIYVQNLLSGLGEPIRAKIRPGGVVEAITYRLTSSQRNMAAIIEREMANAGLSAPEIAAAIVNAFAESRLNPNAVGDGGHSIGLFQLNHPWGAGKDMSVSDRRDPVINTQTILKKEVLARGGRKFRAAAANGASIAELAAIFSRDIERPKDKEGNMRKRANLARKMFS